MSRYHSYLNSAGEILGSYKGEEPFASFIKKYFGQHKKHGSTDRKQISHLCYCYFRLGKALPNLPVKERILAGLLLCSDRPNAILAELQPAWKDLADDPAISKLEKLDTSPGEIFPWSHELSSGIDTPAFSLSHLVQPDLFLRVRPGKEKIVQQKLMKAGVEFGIVSEHTLALLNASKIDEVLALNREAVVQDYNSQQTGEYFKKEIDQLTPLRAWDCCAASGGKSIMLYDLFPGIELTVSDIRESVLNNLRKRFHQAGIDEYRSLVLDLTKDTFDPVRPGHPGFDFILADVPCTGSGTWSRTPEQLFYFDAQRIGEYAARQKKIVTHVISLLEPGGCLLYITCSVFRKENEEVVDYISKEHNLQVRGMKLLNGYDKKADTLFVALLRKSKL